MGPDVIEILDRQQTDHGGREGSGLQLPRRIATLASSPLPTEVGMRRFVRSAVASLVAVFLFGLFASPALLQQRGGRGGGGGAAPAPAPGGEGGALALYPKGGPGEIVG